MKRYLLEGLALASLAASRRDEEMIIERLPEIGRAITTGYSPSYKKRGPALTKAQQKRRAQGKRGRKAAARNRKFQN